jgi:hypothetical protein
MPGDAAVVNGDRAAGLGKPPRNTEADDAGTDDNGPGTLLWNRKYDANGGLPPPGMPGQVQWV